ncbi:hypothetical protein [Nocardia xishanensis]
MSRMERRQSDDMLAHRLFEHAFGKSRADGGLGLEVAGGRDAVLPKGRA